MWVNLITEDIYIGSAVDLSKRLRQYFNYNYISDPTRGNSIIYSSLLKYGYGRFSVIIIEYCKKDLLLEREQYYFDTLNPTYNILPIAGSSLGSKRSAEVRQRMSNAQKLVNRTGVNHPLFGKGHSDKTRQKMSASKLGHLVTEEARKKMSKAKTGFNNSMYGKSHSEETKLRISSALSRPVFVYSLTNSLVK